MFPYVGAAWPFPVCCSSRSRLCVHACVCEVSYLDFCSFWCSLAFCTGRGGGYGRHDELERDEDFGGRGFGSRPSGPRTKSDRGFDNRKADQGDEDTDSTFSGTRGYTSRPGWNMDRTPDRFRDQDHGRDQSFGGGDRGRSSFERGERSYDRGFDRDR